MLVLMFWDSIWTGHTFLAGHSQDQTFKVPCPEYCIKKKGSGYGICFSGFSVGKLNPLRVAKPILHVAKPKLKSLRLFGGGGNGDFEAKSEPATHPNPLPKILQNIPGISEIGKKV